MPSDSILHNVVCALHAQSGGGYGDVYKGTYDGKAVAVKSFRIRLDQRQVWPELDGKMCREALTWKHLDHPSLLPFLGVVVHPEHGFKSPVSPWCERGNISAYLRAGHRLPSIEKSLYQLASGIRYMHDENVVHGDLTGNNLLLTDGYDIQICDFGLWKWDETTFVTGGSRAAGTLRYMAPELFGSGGAEPTRPSRASDVFAFACLALEMCTAKIPFDQYQDIIIPSKVMAKERPSPPDGQIIPNYLWKLIEACWAHDSATRPSMGNVVSRMQDWGRPLLSSETSSNIFALVIGINDYHDQYTFPHLRGAVNDARDFKKYLLDSPDDRGLHVPPDNICCLENGEATREGILSAFESHLLNNKNIPDHGEATMIFFFAGHGSRSDAPMNLMARDRKVEVICPVDEGTTDGKDVFAIPDYVLGWLLSQLAAKKGSNTTVIIDCCHSYGLGRDVGMARSALKPSRGIPLELDIDLMEGKTNVASYRLRDRAAGYVLLAACSVRETAREVDDKGTTRGRFTANLISLLRWANTNKATYADLINRMPVWDGQTPHCGGRRNRLIFGGNFPATSRSSFPLLPSDLTVSSPNSSHIFSVPIGSIVGVVPGTEFAAYNINSNFLCTFVAQSVKETETMVTGKADAGEPYPVDIPRWSRVRVSDWQNIDMILRVHTQEGFPHTAYLFPATRMDSTPRFVQSPVGTADVVVRSEDDRIVIEPRTDTMRNCQSISRFPLANPKHLPNAFDGVAHFNYFLERRNKEDPLFGVTLEMHRLRGKMPVREPDKSFGMNGNLVQDGAVKFAQENGAVYGFTIRSASPRDLFPYLFYFDPEDYTIQNWYKPEGRHTTAPLEAIEGRVTVGMGGEPAFEFELPPGQQSSSGFLKLFVTSDYYSDFDWVEQPLSPFDPRYEGVGRLGMKKEMFRTISKWDALTVTLTMTASSTQVEKELQQSLPVAEEVTVPDWKSQTILRVYTAAEFQYTAHLFQEDRTYNGPRFIRSQTLEEAHIVVRSDGDEIVIEPRNGTMRKARTRFKLPGNPEHFSNIFDGVAHFNYFLERRNEANPLEGFMLEMHRLSGDHPHRKPDLSVGQQGNMVMDGEVRFAPDANAKYGFTIRNTSPEDLYLYLICFDPETYTIKHWYSPAGAGAEPPLLSEGRVQIGMGRARPFEFALPPGKASRSWLLKLFVANDYIDLGWIQQDLSPFDELFKGTRRLRELYESLDLDRVPFRWDALTVTLTMA
ncbi:hypothetical protein DFH06DRAFT_472356 [Mycena polygramma]|nr:hypothetical protein DFH06DRAFT_472356 [Mycena polygramma]